MTTRAKSAADSSVARAVRNVAANVSDSAPLQTVKPDDSTPAHPSQEGPLLLRLQGRTIFRREDADKLQPRVGATLEVGGMWHTSRERYTVWLPSTVWDGMASIIRQTPLRDREAVAEFFTLIQGHLNEGPLAGLLNELVDEIRHDPYDGVPEDKPDQFDMNW